MTVLVAYASRHGATAGIAERIAQDLCVSGVAAEACAVTDVRDLSRYDAFVLGSAAYMFHWLRDATAFAKRHRKVLSRHPVWIFSSGPLGTDLVDERGHDVFEASRPKEFDALQTMLQPRDTRVFFGAWDVDAPAIGLGERLLQHMPKSREALPGGDFRDWPAIDAWASEIAGELSHAA